MCLLQRSRALSQNFLTSWWHSIHEVLQGCVFLSSSMHFTSQLSLLSFSPGWALQQSPDTVVRVGDPVTLECSASQKSFVNMYWYKLAMEKDASMQLVVYSVEGGKADIEKEFQNRFQSNGTKNNHLSVKIQYALLNDTGTYFCQYSIAQTFPALCLTEPRFLHFHFTCPPALLEGQCTYACLSVFCMVSNWHSGEAAVAWVSSACEQSSREVSLAELE
uniref:Ig-like domain-containing protein n=1 Tax=Cyanistes caeruleus TaxID=156563 RepID=A0A8C0UM30_CYACU